MTFDEVLDQVRELLRTRGRLSYQSLKARFNLDDQFIEGLKGELIKAERVAVDEEREVLVWTGGQTVASSQLSVVSPQLPALSPQPPAPLQTSDLGPRTSDFPGLWTPLHLAERIRAEQAAMEARGVTDGERKTITALFADIKGSMELIEDLDPEEARALIDPALQLMMDAVHRYEGYVVQSTGDGIFALFGAPLAHEDHAQRALYAALRMQEEIKQYADRLRLAGRRPLEIRIGVNTGEMVVRSIRKDDLHTEYTPIGHSTSLAARLQGLATGGGIVVSESTYRLTDGYFELKALGAAQIKGVTEPVPLYEVLGIGPLRTRLQVAARRGLVRFVGRQSELAQLQKAWELAKAGRGQIVGVMGEPGLGKSRIFYEFKLTSQSGCLVLEAYSVSHGKASPYLPLIELLKSYFQIHPQDEDRQRKEKIAGKVLILDRRLEDILPYLFALLGIEDPTSSLAQMDPHIRRRRTFEAIRKLFLRESLNQPLLLIFEDLHWIDSETQGFLDALSESVVSARILLLVNYRPEYRHEWGTKTYYTQLRLAPLSKDEAEELLTFLLGNDASFKTLKRLILEKTEGTPFFMEEVVQTLVEEHVLVGGRGNYRLEKAPTELHISPTVQGVLAARIDRLGMAEKALLQQLAAIGREFPLSLVRQVVLQPEEELYRLLSSLQSKEFLYERPAFPEVEYLFKHALTQEVAYGTVLQERRKALHEQTAQAIEALYRSSLDDHYSELAHHYSRSGNTPKAVEYLHLAGQQAAQRSATAEAIHHLTAALELLKTLPAAPERTQRELMLQITLGGVLQDTKGFAALEAERVFARARELCQEVGETPHLFPVLFGLGQSCVARAELQTARQLGEQCLRLAQHIQDPTMLGAAYSLLGTALQNQGELALAQEYLERGIMLYGPQQQDPSWSQDSHPRLNRIVPCLSIAAMNLWFLGYPAQAQRRIQEALTLSRALTDPFNLAYALNVAANLHHFRKEIQAAQEQAEALITLSSEHGLSYRLAWGTSWRGWALTAQGQRGEGIAEMRQGLAALQATGLGVIRSYLLGLLAEAYGETGQVEEGLTLLAEAQAAVHKNGERHLEAELYRLKGTLTLKQSEVRSPRSAVNNPQSAIRNPQLEAEACFQKAIEITRQQGAKSLELRAVMSLSRLWQQQGKKEEARQLLAEIYGWFTEGFDTKDLQEAKALLGELAG
ncbi:MAG: AAA family ATPase [Deltaproteobacteria bacterium]|nr:AAA family ATPase [Deltaproteobacteria bacterium]